MNAIMSITPPTGRTIETVKAALRHGIVQVVYKKLNTDINNRKATLNFDLIPTKDQPKGDEKKAANQDEGYIRYYDLTKWEWRQFHIDRLKECNTLFELEPVNEEFEFHTLRFKKLTYEAVSRVATEVFMTKKALTTLSLKTELRAQGYWAKQEAVSELMDEVFKKDDAWDYKQPQDGETFRVYFIREEEVVTV